MTKRKANIPPEWRDCNVVLDAPHCGASRTYHSLCRDGDGTDHLVTRSMVDMIIEQETGTVLWQFTKDMQEMMASMEERLSCIEERIEKLENWTL